jgi:hypothetical protein
MAFAGWACCWPRCQCKRGVRSMRRGWPRRGGCRLSRSRCAAAGRPLKAMRQRLISDFSRSTWQARSRPSSPPPPQQS